MLKAKEEPFSKLVVADFFDLRSDYSFSGRALRALIKLRALARVV